LTRATTLLEDWRSAQVIRKADGTNPAAPQQESSTQEVIQWEKPARGSTNVISMPHSPSLLTELVLVCVIEMMLVTLCLRELIGFLLYVKLQ